MKTLNAIPKITSSKIISLPLMAWGDVVGMKQVTVNTFTVDGIQVTTNLDISMLLSRVRYETICGLTNSTRESLDNYKRNELKVDHHFRPEYLEFEF